MRIVSCLTAVAMFAAICQTAFAANPHQGAGHGVGQTACKASGSPMSGKAGQVMLNPQPEPPGVQGDKAPAHPSAAVMLNPQPEPPGVQDRVATSKGPAAPGSSVMFNPQPDPPGLPACAAAARH